MSGNSGKVSKNKKKTSQEKIGVLKKKVMKSQKILYKHAVNKKVYHH